MIDQAKQLWEQMPSGNRRRLIVLAAGVLVATVALLVWVLRPTYSVLYSDLQPDDASAIVDYLTQHKVPYRLTGRGTVVQVPQSQVYDLRVKTAAQGLLSQGTVGFEIFDRATLPGTDFANRVNLQRALQGELERTLDGLAEVSAARVHLVLPEDSLIGPSKPAQASAVVDLKAGQTLSPEEVRGIQMLIARSVQGLQPNQVTLLNGRGDVLGGGDGGDLALTSSQLEAKTKYEDLLRERVQRMLDAAVGPNKSVVQVHASMLFDQADTTSEKVTPVTQPGGGGALTREQTYTENYQGQGAGATASGPAGASSNVWAASPPGTTGASGKYSHTESTKEYEFSRTVTKTTSPPGQVKHLSVAVIVDSGAKVNPVAIKSLVEAAVGAQPSRGDIVDVTQMPLDLTKTAAQDAKQAKQDASSQHRAVIFAQALRYVGGLLLVIVLGLFLLSASRQFRAAVGAGARPAGEDGELVAAGAGQGAGGLPGGFGGLPAGQSGQRAGAGGAGDGGTGAGAWTPAGPAGAFAQGGAAGAEDSPRSAAEAAQERLRRRAEEDPAAFAAHLQALIAGEGKRQGQGA